MCLAACCWNGLSCCRAQCKVYASGFGCCCVTKQTHAHPEYLSLFSAVRDLACHPQSMQPKHCLSADIKMQWGDKKHELNVSTYHMCILLLFNESYRDILTATGIPAGDLKRALQSLALVKVGCVACNGCVHVVTAISSILLYYVHAAQRLSLWQDVQLHMH